MDEPDFEWLMIDTSPCEGTSWCMWSSGWKSGYGTYKRGLNTRIHLAVDAHGMPVRILVTEGTRADCKEAIHLIEGISAQALLADRAYDTSEIISYARNAGYEYCHSKQKEPQTFQRIWYLSVQTAAFGRECLPETETMEGDCHQIRQVYRYFCGCCTGPLYSSLGCCSYLTHVDTI